MVELLLFKFPNLYAEFNFEISFQTWIFKSIFARFKYWDWFDCKFNNTNYGFKIIILK